MADAQRPPDSGLETEAQPPDAALAGNRFTPGTLLAGRYRIVAPLALLED